MAMRDPSSVHSESKIAEPVDNSVHLVLPHVDKVRDVGDREGLRS